LPGSTTIGVCFSLVLTGLASPCLAAAAPPFAVLMHEAQGVAPSLLESRANVGAAQGKADQAGALPNPTAGILFENLASNNRADGLTGISPEQTTISLTQPIELGGKRDARMAAGDAELNAAQVRDQQTLAAFSYELAVVYAGAEAATARVKLYEDAVKSANDDQRAAQALVDAGREAGIRAKQANAAFLAAQSDLENARADAELAFAKLSVLVAAPQPYTDVVPSLLPLADHLKVVAPTPPKNFLSVAVAEAERDAAQGRLEVERARAVPDVNATLGVRRLTGDRATVVVAGLSVPIPLFDQNSGNISAAGSEVAAADARLAAARADAETGWSTAVAQARASALRLSAAQSAATAAEEAYELTRTGYNSGKTSLLDLLTSRRALTDAHLRLLDTELGRIGAEAALARLAGRVAFGDNP
jgi:outer membrane protein, heavy metal efflux system